MQRGVNRVSSFPIMLLSCISLTWLPQHPRHPPANPTPLPFLALMVKLSSLKHDWQHWEPITHLELRIALLAIISAVRSDAETWAVSIQAAPLFLSYLLPPKPFHLLTMTVLKPNAEACSCFKSETKAPHHSLLAVCVFLHSVFRNLYTLYRYHWNIYYAPMLREVKG